jgi:hypothetical protein
MSSFVETVISSWDGFTTFVAGAQTPAKQRPWLYRGQSEDLELTFCTNLNSSLSKLGQIQICEAGESPPSD